LFEQALQKDPDLVPALSQLVGGLLKEKKVDVAIERCRKQIAKRPGNPGYYVLLAKLISQKGDYKEALMNFEKALEMDPQDMEALFGVARMEQMMGSLDAALEKYQAIRKRDPDNLVASMLAATLLEQKGNADEASAIYREVLKRNPNVPAAANNLAFYYAEHAPTTPNLQEAKRLVGPLLQKYGENPNLVDTVAWIEYRQGNLSKAKDLLLGLSEKDRRTPIIAYHMGMVQLGLGEKTDAAKSLKMAANSPERFPGKGEAEKTLKEMGE